MCGISGLLTAESSGFWHEDKELFKDLLIATSVRGIDSTGVFGATKEGATSWVKRIGDPYKLFEFHHTAKWFEEMGQDFKLVVGHNRAATKGEVSAKNAHPFEKENIILVHNGTLTNHYELKQTYGGEVDSETCASMIKEIGPVAALKEIRGAFAFVWFDSNERCLYMVRNDERPLHITTRIDKKTLMFASELETLVWAAGRRNIKTDGPKYLKPGVMYKFHIDNLTKYETEEVKLAPKSVYNQHVYNIHNAAYWEGHAFNKDEEDEETLQRWNQVSKVMRRRESFRNSRKNVPDLIEVVGPHRFQIKTQDKFQFIVEDCVETDAQVMFISNINVAGIKIQFVWYVTESMYANYLKNELRDFMKTELGEVPPDSKETIWQNKAIGDVFTVSTFSGNIVNIHALTKRLDTDPHYRVFLTSCQPVSTKSEN